MIPLQHFDKNVPRTISCMPSTVNEIYGNHQQFFPSQLQITIDTVDLLENILEMLNSSDAESSVDDESDGDDSSCCSVNIDNDSPDNDYFRKLPHVLRTHHHRNTRPSLDDCIRMVRNNVYDDDDNESISAESYDSLEDARLRGISKWSKKRHSKRHDGSTSSRQPLLNQRKHYKKSNAQKSDGGFDFENFEELEYSINLK